MDDTPVKVWVESDELYPHYWLLNPGREDGVPCELSPETIIRIHRATQEYFACQEILKKAAEEANRGPTEAERLVALARYQAEEAEKKKRGAQAMADLLAKQKGER